MFDISILNLAITLVFVYLILSIMASTIHEIINSITNMRGKRLLKALKELYSDENLAEGKRKWEDFYNEHILTSPFIISLKQKKLFTNSERQPSYIPAKNFTLALYSVLLADSENEKSSDLKTIIENDKNLPDQLRVTLLTLHAEAKGNLDNFLNNIEEFYENAVERTSGEFKRYTQVWMFVLGLIIAISLNVDTIHISDTLWKNKKQLNLTAEAIESKIGQINSMGASLDKLNSKMSGTKGIIEGDSVKIAKSDIDSVKSDLDKLSEQYSLLKSVETIPIGYDSDNYFFSDKDPVFQKIITPTDTTIIYQSVIPNRIPKLLGWLLTTLAVYLGAPFWFEIINKFINLRGSGKKPEDEKDSKNGKA